MFKTILEKVSAWFQDQQVIDEPESRCYDCWHSFKHHTKVDKEDPHWDMGCALYLDEGKVCDCFMFFPCGLG